ncbi:MAG: Hsp20/alpha crystallin family protein [Cyanophyceae cyanobacterium]
MTSTTSWTPAIDLQETNSQLILKAELPGINKKELKVQVGSEAILIAGEHRERDCAPDDVVCREMHHGYFQRVVSLPMPIECDRVRAELVDGILTVTMTKVQSVAG